MEKSTQIFTIIKYQKKTSQCICLSVILINSVYSKDKNYHPRAFLEECKYVFKRNKTSKFITTVMILMILIKKILMEKIQMKKILIKKIEYRFFFFFFSENYKKFFGFVARKFHSLKYRKNTINFCFYQAWEISSWNIIRFF